MTPEFFVNQFLAQPHSSFHKTAVYIKNRELAVGMLEDQLKLCHEGGVHLAAKLLETQRELSRVIRKGKR